MDINSFVDESEEAECITGIDYFTDHDNNSSNTGGNIVSQQVDVQPQPYSIVNGGQRFQYVYVQSGGLVSSVPRSVAQNVSSGSSALYNQPASNSVESEGDILGLPAGGDDDIVDVTPPKITAPVLVSNVNVLGSKGCSLCRKRFTDASALLRHMQEYHHIDPAHVLQRRNRQLGQVQVQQAQVRSNIVTTPTSYNPPQTTSSGATASLQVLKAKLMLNNAASNTSTSPGPSNPVTTGSYVIPSYNGILSTTQVKQAQDLIAADADSFYCTYCYTRFATRSLAESHARVRHLGEKPYLCVHCNCRYSSQVDHAVCPSEARHAQTPQPPQRSASDMATMSFKMPGMPVTVFTRRNMLPKIAPKPPATELPPSSSEISSTSSGNEFQPRMSTFESILSSSSVSPDCEVSSQALDENPVVLKVVESKISLGDGEHFGKYISATGELNKSQTDFAERMIRRVPATKEDPIPFFQCKICNSKYKNGSTCRQHIRHGHLKEHYRCGMCSKTFDNKLVCERHRDEHTGRKAETSGGGGGSSGSSSSSQTHSTHITEPVGISPHLLPTYAATFVQKRSDGRFGCTKCRKFYNANNHAVSHVRQAHFGKASQCKTCGLYFEFGLVTHREKCNPSKNSSHTNSGAPAEKNAASKYSKPVDTTKEVAHLASMMRESVQIVKNPRNPQMVSAFKCVLCPSKFSSRSNAEAHLWIEHIRSEWKETMGNDSNVDDIYMQFLQAQVSRDTQAGSSEFGRRLPTNATNLPAEERSFVHEDSSNNGFYNEEEEEEEEEMAFDPSTMVTSQIYVEESSTNSNKFSEPNSATHSMTSDPIEGALHCKVEMEDEPMGNYYDESDNQADEPTAGGDNGSHDGQENPFEGSSVDEKVPAPAPQISEAELQQLRIKALQFIKEKQGSFVCTICQRVSKLRRELVEHVRRIHLCGETEDDGAKSLISASTGTRSDYFNAIVDHAVKDGLSSSKSYHVSQKTKEERAARFIRPDGPEVVCTICNIRSTQYIRLVEHVSAVHFGENGALAKKIEDEPLKCPGCSKVMPDKSFKARHVARCILAKRLARKQGAMVNAHNLPPPPARTGPLMPKRKPGRPPKKYGRPVPSQPRSAVHSTIASSMADKVSGLQTTVPTRYEVRRKVESEPEVQVIIAPTKAQSQKSTAQPSTLSNMSKAVPGAQQVHASIAKTISAKINVQGLDPAPVRWKPAATLNKKAEAVSNAENNNAVEMSDEDCKKLIIDWSIGGKYTFFKCKECSVLFTKYSNAETHVRKFHAATPKQGSTSEGKAAAPVVGKTTRASGAKSDEVIEIPDEEEDKDEQVTNVPMDTEQNDSDAADEADVYETPMSYSDDDRDDGGVEDDTKEEEIYQPESPSKARNKLLTTFRPFASLAVDVLKKYKQPKRVSQNLTSLTSKEFSDAQKFIVKLQNQGYECRGCDQKFPRLNAISRHVRLKHFVERPYFCTTCDQRFFHLYEFETHKTACTGKSKEATAVAPKLLAKSGAEGNQPEDAQNSDYYSEKNVEDSVKFAEKISKNKFRCTICKDSFGGGYKACLQHIRKIHFKERPYECSNCHERFRYLKPFQNHTKACGVPTSALPVPASAKGDTSKDSSIKESQPQPRDNAKYKCKLCKEVLDDKPLFRYHLVSVHYGELCSKGSSTNFFDMTDDVIDTLKEVDEAPALSPQPEEPMEQASEPDKIEAKKEPEPTCVPVIVHQNEKELLASLSSISSASTSSGAVIQRTTVRLERLSFNGPLPSSLLEAAKKLCVRVDGATFQCLSCGKCLSTKTGCLQHVRIQHFGEKRHQCEFCLQFIADGLNKHRARCEKRRASQSQSSQLSTP